MADSIFGEISGEHYTGFRHKLGDINLYQDVAEEFLTKSKFASGGHVEGLHPEADVLIAWRPDEKSPISVVYPAFIKHLAVQFKLFQLFYQDVYISGKTPYTAKWPPETGALDVESKSLPLVLFTGTEMQPRLLPHIVEYSISGKLPEVASLVALMGRYLGSPEIANKGAYLLDKSIRKMVSIKGLVKQVEMFLVDFNLKYTRGIDNEKLINAIKGLSNFTNLSEMLSNPTMYITELTRINKQMKVDTYDMEAKRWTSVLERLPFTYLLKVVDVIIAYKDVHLPKLVEQITAKKAAIAGKHQSSVDELEEAKVGGYNVDFLTKNVERYEKGAEAMNELMDRYYNSLVKELESLVAARDVFVKFLRTTELGSEYTEEYLRYGMSFNERDLLPKYPLARTGRNPVRNFIEARFFRTAHIPTMPEPLPTAPPDIRSDAIYPPGTRPISPRAANSPSLSPSL